MTKCTQRCIKTLLTSGEHSSNKCDQNNRLALSGKKITFKMKLFTVLFFIVVAIASSSVNGEDDSQQKCKPGSKFKIECNNCVCSKDGTQIACTRMACPPTTKRPWGPLYVPGTRCPSKQFYSECNSCVCGKDGKSAVCTLIACGAQN